jgi:hypothetical protein
MTMSVRDSAVRLEQSLAELDAALDHVALIAGDLPEPEDEPAVVDALRDRVDGIRGELQESSSAVRAASIVDAHAAFNTAARRIRLELTAPSNAEEIAAVAASRGGAWTRWSDVVRRALDDVGAASDTVAAALLDCWRELATQYRIPVRKEMPHA